MSESTLRTYGVCCAASARTSRSLFRQLPLVIVLTGLLVLNGCASMVSNFSLPPSASKLETADRPGNRQGQPSSSGTKGRSNALSTEATGNAVETPPLALAPAPSILAASNPYAGFQEPSSVQTASFQESVGNAGMPSEQIDPIIATQHDQRMYVDQTGGRSSAGQFEVGQAAPQTMGRSDASVPFVQDYDSSQKMNAFSRDNSQYHPGHDGYSRMVPHHAVGRSGIVNVVGAEFRQRNPTATEIMISMKSENQMLRRKITELNLNVQRQQQIIAQERGVRESVEAELVASKNQNRELREMIAKLQVELEQLQLDKQAVEQRADRALREIESALDSTLINSVIKTMNDK